jgi:hypothetical protein
MRSFTQFSKGLFAAGILAISLAGISGCGPDYALFKVDVSSSTSPRNDIEECRMTITNGDGRTVLDSFVLATVAGPPDSSGNLTLAQGCGGGITNAHIGTFSYSSSRTTGTLKFRVDAYNASGSNGGQKIVQTGESAAVAPAKYPPEVPVTVVIK